MVKANMFETNPFPIVVSPIIYYITWTIFTLNEQNPSWPHQEVALINFNIMNKNTVYQSQTVSSISTKYNLMFALVSAQLQYIIFIV